MNHSQNRVYFVLYMARHDCLVDLVLKDLRKINCGQDIKVYNHSTVKMNWFQHSRSDNNIQSTSDLIIVNEA